MCSRDYDVELLTGAYVASIKVYVHVIVSGAYPDVSDIQDAVDEFIRILRRLTHARVLCRLAWPLCVVASLAENRHEAFFNRIEHGARQEPDFYVGVLRALKIARRCQTLRHESKEGTRTFDWFDATDSLGESWVLV